MTERTQVGIVGAGPAGLLLSHLLKREGIESIIVENRSRDYVEARIRAGLLEQGTVDLLTETGLADRLHREGMRHGGIELRFDGVGHHIDFEALVGRTVTIYGQHEIVKDLIAARLAAGDPIVFEASDVAVHDIEGARPRITYEKDGAAHEIDCDFIAGCDGFHGICRPAMQAVITEYDREYPFAWLGILSQSPPAHEELIYTLHPSGFSLLTMRSPTMSRHYLQCAPDEDIADWSDERIWQELQSRNALAAGGFSVPEGRIVQKGVTPMRSYVCEPMQHGKLFLAGDSAHIVPPTGAKGMNLAIADVRYLTEAMTARYRGAGDAALAGYSARCLERVWKAQRFSWWMTTMLHLDPEASLFDRRRQRAELAYVTSSEAAMRSLAENYVGLPF